jgi:antitoxin (DNA-binding transcriptional repressor) of toxin-antitoxin stability system
MPYMAVKDLKRTRELWARLGRERELIITKEGAPCAIMVSVSPDTVEASLAGIRRALFSAAVSRARQAAEQNPPAEAEIELLIQQSRRERGVS